MSSERQASKANCPYRAVRLLLSAMICVFIAHTNQQQPSPKNASSTPSIWRRAISHDSAFRLFSNWLIANSGECSSSYLMLSLVTNSSNPHIWFAHPQYVQTESTRTSRLYARRAGGAKPFIFTFPNRSTTLSHPSPPPEPENYGSKILWGDFFSSGFFQEG